MEKLVEIMLNEGLNENTIVNVLKALVNEDATEGSKSMSLLAFTNGIKKGATGTRKEAIEKLIQDLTADIKPKKLTPKSESFQGSLSESCFNDIIGLVECIINETKKANKEAHQEAIFKKLNPEGEFVSFTNYHGYPFLGKLKSRMTNVKTNNRGNTSGTVHSLKDYRLAMNTDNIDSDTASDVRDLLGRNNIFCKRENK